MSIGTKETICTLPHYDQCLYFSDENWNNKQFCVVENIISLEIDEEINIYGKHSNDLLVINYWRPASAQIYGFETEWTKQNIYLGPGDKVKLNPDDNWIVLTKDNIQLWKEQLHNLLAINSLPDE